MFSKLFDRFKEPSSWASVAALLALVGLQVDESLWQSIVWLGAGAAGVLGFMIREKTA